MAWLVMPMFIFRAQENRYVGFGNTVPPQKREDDFLNNAMSSLYSVRRPRFCRVPPVADIARGLSSARTRRTLPGQDEQSWGTYIPFDLLKALSCLPFSEWFFLKTMVFLLISQMYLATYLIWP